MGTLQGYGLKRIPGHKTNEEMRNDGRGQNTQNTAFPKRYDFLKTMTCCKIKTENVKISQITYFNKSTLLCILLKATKQAQSHLG
jgi:hypothetical protein